MKITSIISEYNPFHEGHKYHMEKTKKITDSNYTIVLMSGDFTQRGTPAILNKYARTRQALNEGADLVLELPVCFATASAEGFAFGAVSILDKLGVVDSLVFGSESGDIEKIRKTADFLSQETSDYKDRLQTLLKQGMNYPKARACALNEFLPTISQDFLNSPNNILGIEYCRALKYFHSSITPVTLLRKDNHYHETDLSQSGMLSSATAIRNLLTQRELSFFPKTTAEMAEKKDDIFRILASHMPSGSLAVLKENWGRQAPVVTNDFSLLLKYRLLLEHSFSLTDYLDVSSDLADRIYKSLNAYETFDSFCDLLKTKELTHTRISRSLMHILLDIRKEDFSDIRNAGYGQYARILGFRKDALPLLHEIKSSSSIPFISKLADSVRELDGISLSMLQKDIQAAHIYESVAADKFRTSFQNEFSQKLVII